MRRLTVLLILGAILGFVIFEYMVQDQERRLKRRERIASPRGEVLQKETASATSTSRQWKGTDVTPAVPAKNDLMLIDGIGPAFAKALNALGIYTFAQLVQQSPDDLADRMAARITAERIRRDRWIEQARALARGG